MEDTLINTGLIDKSHKLEPRPGSEVPTKNCRPRSAPPLSHKAAKWGGADQSTHAGITRPPKKTEGASSERTRTQAIRTACFKVPKGASLKKSPGNFMVMPNCKQHCDQCRQPAATQRKAARLRHRTRPGMQHPVQLREAVKQPRQ